MESWMVFVIGAVAFVIIVYVISLISGSTSKQVKEQQEEQHKEHLKALTKELNELKEEKVSSFVRVKTLLEVIGATIDKEIKEEFESLMKEAGCYFLSEEETKKLRKVMFLKEKGDALNADIVGKSPYNIAKGAGIKVPEDTKVLVLRENGYKNI